MVFLGDSMLQSIYGGLNILLRQNQVLGTIAQWEMSDVDLLYTLQEIDQ